MNVDSPSQSGPKIEIYGIPEHLARCYGCISAVNLLNELGLDFEFYPVLVESNNQLGFDFDRVRIAELQKKVGKPTPPTSYPQIIVDGVWIGGFLKLKAYFGQND